MNAALTIAARIALVASAAWVISCADVLLNEQSQARRIKRLALRTAAAAGAVVVVMLLVRVGVGRG